MFPSLAFAYLDPATGSLLLSSIVAIFASGIFFFRGVVYRLSFLVGNIRYGGGKYVFDLLYNAQERGFAPFGNEDDYFIRIIAKKIRI